MKYDYELLSTRVNSKHLAEKLLIYSSCIAEEYPGILKKFTSAKLRACPEKFHINQIAWKTLNIIRASKIKEITILTLDGSPHCVQMHHALEDIKRFTDISVRHFVIEKGKLLEVNSEAVKKSRHLSQIED